MNRNNQLKMIALSTWGNYLRGRWRDCFAKHLSIEEQNEIWMDDFLWHLCSWNKVICLEKEEAISAFLNQTKHKCTIFYQFMDEAYLVENADSLLINELPYREHNMYYNDLYVMDWNYRWTFIMTHEPECGPYFIQRD